jgi:hypothetical protein
VIRGSVHVISVPDCLPYNQEIIADALAGARAHDGEFAQCIASAGRDRDGRFAEVHLGKIPHQRLVERVIQTGRNDLRFEQRGNLIEPFEQFALISGQIRHANPFYRTLRLLRKQRQVLGIELNRSELIGE